MRGSLFKIFVGLIIFFVFFHFVCYAQGGKKEPIKLEFKPEENELLVYKVCTESSRQLMPLKKSDMDKEMPKERSKVEFLSKQSIERVDKEGKIYISRWIESKNPNLKKIKNFKSKLVMLKNGKVINVSSDKGIMSEISGEMSRAEYKDITGKFPSRKVVPGDTWIQKIKMTFPDGNEKIIEKHYKFISFEQVGEYNTAKIESLLLRPSFLKVDNFDIYNNIQVEGQQMTKEVLFFAFSEGKIIKSIKDINSSFILTMSGQKWRLRTHSRTTSKLVE